ncbi:hypothetical protein GMD78_09660 [Ornithinibacillus sp. L9]|uniref:Uncharacterized protein n=1 Tax=Ornithinibacillus caprae TaxID=2678566 RepID=A0A6N8FIZ9_9BACI|nr:hypothetical protein [Ornithinibacillus caprae]MUK88656.1 hypothetical protein [Ornithinibacillus caprae]
MELIKHRGPDESSFYQDFNIVMDFLYLRIIDKDGGGQPFFFHDDRIEDVYDYDNA